MADQRPAFSEREQAIMGVKIFVGVIFGAIMMTIVGPIVLAIIIGLADGH
jgi:hypothetical protein